MADKKNRFRPQLFDVLMQDGTEYLDIQVMVVDRMAEETYGAGRKNWADQHNKRLLFWCWNSLARNGRLPQDDAANFERWRRRTADIVKQDDADDDESDDPDAELGPTRTTREDQSQT